MLDALRGFAVLLMIFFHLFYDLNLFRLVTIDLFGNPFWFAFPRVIVSLFLICVGIGLSLVHKSGIDWNHVRRRFIRIGGFAMLITGITYLIFPKRFIFFGILHCIAVSSVLGLVFVKYPKISLTGCIALLLPYAFFQPSLSAVSRWIGVSPFDFVPLYPWFGLVLLGIFLESVRFHEIPIKAQRIEWLVYFGKHSLVIYLIHQPILFGTCYLIYKIHSGA